MKKKIVVIDDSALMRKLIREMLEEAGYEVVIARNGEEGLERIRTTKPDAATLDINMPVMDGLTCLSHIMTEMPLPVLMVSSLTEKGALATFEALELGAVDYVAKPGGTVSLNVTDIKQELLAKMAATLRSRIGKAHGLRERLRRQREAVVSQHEAREKKLKPRVQRADITGDGVVVIGVSTGGPGTLEEILTKLPADFPWPILVAQHMPARFTQVFAGRLNEHCALNIQEIDRAIDLEPGQVLVARGDADVKLIRRRTRLMATSIPARPEYIWHPSVALLVNSVAEHYPPQNIVCVQLTGMGNDGAAEMAKLNHLGARTIAESEESAVVFGMPRELIELDGADKILHSKNVAKQLIDWIY